MKEFLISLLDFFGLAFWVEIITEVPRCTYYFGPFLSRREAEALKAGYIEDIQLEGATGITVNIKRCKPANLTVDEEDLGEKSPGKVVPIFSIQS